MALSWNRYIKKVIVRDENREVRDCTQFTGNIRQVPFTEHRSKLSGVEEKPCYRLTLLKRFAQRQSKDSESAEHVASLLANVPQERGSAVSA